MDPYSNPMLMQYLMRPPSSIPQISTSPLSNPAPQVAMPQIGGAGAAIPHGFPAGPTQQKGILGDLMGNPAVMGGLMGMLKGGPPNLATAGITGGLGANGVFWNSGRQFPTPDFSGVSPGLLRDDYGNIG